MNLFNFFKKQPELHDWQLIAKSYAPTTKPLEGADAATVSKAMFGVTTLLWQDMVTGDIRKEEMLGSDENQLEALLTKCAQYGMQYVEHNGKQFAVAEVPVDTEK